MRRPKLKKSSKRMSCHKRYKIQKKVREHNRKVRKEAKKSGFRKPKKDISVPNDAPFKEDILREAELRKQMREDLKKAQKLERQKEVAKKRKLEEKKEKPEPKPKEQKKVPEKTTKPTKPVARNSVQSFCLEVKKVIDAADVVLEVLDARDPLGSRCLQAEQMILQSDKKLLLVLNKTDLVPKNNLEKWLHFLNKELPTVVFKCSSQVLDKNLPSNGPKSRSAAIDISKGTVCYGGASLLSILHHLCPSPNENIKVGLIGFANVGKSSLINSLKQCRVCNVGALKGTTRILQDVNIDQKIKMSDSPSLVVSPDNPPATFVMRSVFQKVDEDILESVRVIIKHCDKQQAMMHYNISDFRNSLEFLDLLARKRGFLMKGGVPDVKKAARLFLDDWMGARLSYHTNPPAASSCHISNEQTAAMQKGVNLEALNEENKKIVKALKCPSPASSILFHFSHMTNGILENTELEEPEEEESDDEEEEGEEMEEEEDDNGLEEDDGLEVEEEDDDDGQEVEAADNGKELVETNDGKEEKPKKVSFTPAPKQTDSTKSVRFDKPEEDADDAYDFSTDFN